MVVDAAANLTFADQRHEHSNCLELKSGANSGAVEIGRCCLVAISFTTRDGDEGAVFEVEGRSCL
jgi:hypothetical protein